MPAAAAPEAAAMSVEAAALVESLRCGRDILVLDCRPPDLFAAGHVRGALSVGLPALLLRRLAAGKLSLPQVERHLAPDADRLAAVTPRGALVLYDARDPRHAPPPSLMAVLCRKFTQEGRTAHCLAGGYEHFAAVFPEWVEVSGAGDPPPPLVGLKSLRISCLEEEEEEDGGGGGGGQDSSLGRATPLDDLGFPVEILPHLFLGNAKNSGDSDALTRHKIRYIINVTPNLPNVFESSGAFKYMKIPIADHWSQNLASFFPQAIQFIEEAREAGVAVLVHCLAGISRSVTITVAYLMYKERLSLEAAYDHVRTKKADIAPNFNFMGQLQDFQQQLNLSPRPCACGPAPCRCGSAPCRCGPAPCRCRSLHFLGPPRSSPDSGIEFDRFS